MIKIQKSKPNRHKIYLLENCPSSTNNREALICNDYTSEPFTLVLKDAGIKISMDGKGRWMDNVLVECLWRSIKYENVYLNEYASAEHLRQGLKQYFRYYNFDRTHQSLENLTPDEVYNGFSMQIAA